MSEELIELRKTKTWAVVHDGKKYIVERLKWKEEERVRHTVYDVDRGSFIHGDLAKDVLKRVESCDSGDRIWD